MLVIIGLLGISLGAKSGMKFGTWVVRLDWKFTLCKELAETKLEKFNQCVVADKLVVGTLSCWFAMIPC